MDFGTILTLFETISIDMKNKTLRISIGGVIIVKNISFATIKKLTKNSSYIGSLLSSHFINRQVMWQDFRKENVALCIKSLMDLKLENFQHAQRLGESRTESDQFLSSWLLYWGNECDRAIKEFQDAIQNEKISRSMESDSEFVLRAHKEIPKILGEFRRKTYPAIQILIDLLDERNPVREQAVSRLNLGKNLLVQHYGISINKLLDPNWKITDPTG